MEELAQWLKQQHKGLRTYKTFQQKVLEIGSKKRRQYALFYLLAMLAGRFVEAYDENPLVLDVADEAHKRLVAFTDKAVRFGSMNPQQQIELLNEIAASELTQSPT